VTVDRQQRQVFLLAETEQVGTGIAGTAAAGALAYCFAQVTLLSGTAFPMRRHLGKRVTRLAFPWVAGRRTRRTSLPLSHGNSRSHLPGMSGEQLVARSVAKDHDIKALARSKFLSSKAVLLTGGRTQGSASNTPGTHGSAARPS
jgi:hypothetical protein